MNVKASFRYQLRDSFKAVVVFYIVILALNLVFATAVTIVQNVVGTQMGSNAAGFDTATGVFLFVVGLCSFKENFYLLTQSGTSRKSLVLGQFGSALVLAGALAVIDKLLYLLMDAVGWLLGSFGAVTMYEMEYPLQTLFDHLPHLLFTFTSYLACISVGYLVTVLYYRMPAGAKVAVSVGVPVLLFIVLPIVDSTLTNGVIFGTMAKVVAFAMGLSGGIPGNPWMAILSFVVLSAAFGGISWLMIRRAAVKG